MPEILLKIRGKLMYAKKNILVIYDIYMKHPLRQTFHDHLYCFKKYSRDNVFYCNYAYGLPKQLLKIPFDLVIFHHSFSGILRAPVIDRDSYLSKLTPLKVLKGPKIAFCQDEFVNMERFCSFANDFNLKTIYSVADPTQWPLLYSSLNPKIKIECILTGYFDDDVLKVVDEMREEISVRDIDVGYRATHAEPWLGKLGRLKILIAEKLLPVCQKMGMKIDISTVVGEGKFYHGLDWHRFLCRCKNFLGVEGGSSLLDVDGKIQTTIQNNSLKNPRQSFEEIERNCFPGLDGNIHYVALSPRHLEACATKTCQILLEGKYNGILQPNLHYIEVKKDFSNVEECLTQSLDVRVREKLTSKAYQDVVLSGKYHYKSVIPALLAESFENQKAKKSVLVKLLCPWYDGRDRLLWRCMRLEIRCKEFLKRILPEKGFQALKGVRNKFYKSNNELKQIK